jgi:hypothetical protein
MILQLSTSQVSRIIGTPPQELIYKTEIWKLVFQEYNAKAWQIMTMEHRKVSNMWGETNIGRKA